MRPSSQDEGRLDLDILFMIPFMKSKNSFCSKMKSGAKTTFRLMLSIILGLAVCFALNKSCAFAQQQQQPPRFAFTASDPIKLTAGSAAVQAQLQNNTAEPITVELRIVDFGPTPEQSASKVIKLTSPLKLEPTGSEVITIKPPSDAEFKPFPDSVKGYLVAIEQGKQNFDRRVIEIDKPAPASTNPQPGPVPADFLQELSLSGINFVPSLLSALVPFILVLLLAVLLAYQGSKWIKPKQKSQGKQRSSGIPWIGVLLLAAWLFIGVWLGHYWYAPNFSHIVMSPLALTAQSGIMGGVSGSDGSSGKLESDGKQLTVKGLSHAGTYTGIARLPARSKDPDVKVTVNVSDWWPYALIAITLGVLLGYKMTRYFKQQRDEDVQRLRGAQLWHKVVSDENLFSAEHGGLPFARYQIVDITKDWLGLVEQSLDAGQAADAKTHLDHLETYINLFAQFRVRLVALYETQTRAWQQVKHINPDLLEENLVAFTKADEILEGDAFNLSPKGDEDEQGTKLTGSNTRVQDLTGWIVAIEETLRLINSYVESAKQIKTDGWSQANLDKLHEQQGQLQDALSGALMASKKDDLDAFTKNAATAYSIILRLKDSAGKKALTPPDNTVHEKALALHSMAVAAMALPFGQPGSATPASDISVKSLEHRLISLAHQSADSDAIFIFTANLAMPAPALDEYKLQWDFGDSTKTDVRISSPKAGESTVMQISHRYNKRGDYTVTLNTFTGAELARDSIKVNYSTNRLARLLASFSMSERQMSIIAGLLAIGLGFQQLYLKQATWGTTADYLYALLWGSVVSEGLKYAASIVGRKWEA